LRPAFIEVEIASLAKAARSRVTVDHFADTDGGSSFLFLPPLDVPKIRIGAKENFCSLVLEIRALDD